MRGLQDYSKTWLRQAFGLCLRFGYYLGIILAFGYARSHEAADGRDFTTSVPFFLILVALIGESVSSLGFTLCSLRKGRARTMHGLSPFLNLPNILALVVITWQLVELNSFILGDLQRIEKSQVSKIKYKELEGDPLNLLSLLGVAEENEEESADSQHVEGVNLQNIEKRNLDQEEGEEASYEEEERPEEEDFYATFTLHNGTVISGEELNSLCQSTDGYQYVAKPSTAKIYFWMRTEIYVIFMVFPLYHYLRYKLDVKDVFDRKYCWFLPKLTEAYTLIAIDSLEMVFETKNLIPCGNRELSNATFVVIALTLLPLIVMLRRDRGPEEDLGMGHSKHNSKHEKHENPYFLPVSAVIQETIFLNFRMIIIILNFTKQDRYGFFLYIIHLKTTTICFVLKNLFGLISELLEIRHLWSAEEETRKRRESEFQLGISV